LNVALGKIALHAIEIILYGKVGIRYFLSAVKYNEFECNEAGDLFFPLLPFL